MSDAAAAHRRSRICLLATLVLLLALLPATARAAGEPGPCGAPADHDGGDWPVYGHDLRNTRSQPAETTISPATVGELGEAWFFDADDHGGGALNTTPIVWAGCVFVVPSSGEVHALNADTGEPVWHTQLEAVPAGYGGGVTGAPAVVGDTLVVVVNRLGSPYLSGLDVGTGAVRWTTVLDDTATAMTNASVAAFDGMALVGFSGSSGGNPAERGGFAIVSATGEDAGAVLARTRTIPDEDYAAGYAGASIWSTAAVDAATGYAYVGAGNPHSNRVEHPHSNAILKIDVDRTRATFGQIVDSYKGRTDNYVGGLDQTPACQQLPPVHYFPGSSFAANCGQLDLDFGASPNLFANSAGETLVGDLQKAGVYHAANAATMDAEWEVVAGVPCVSCNGSSGAFDGERIHFLASPPGQVFAVDRDAGGAEWVAPVASGLAYFSVSQANGVTYVTDTYGFLNAFDAESGEQLLKLPMGYHSTPRAGAAGSSGVAIARNTVYAATGSRLFAFGLGAGGGDPPQPPVEPPAVPVGSVVVAGPGAQFAGYATPVVPVTVGGALAFHNGDLPLHDVVARAAGDGTDPWCGRYPAGKCPLFWSKLVALGASTEVLGTENLVSGQSYEFYCSLHPDMRGTLLAR